MVGGLLIQEDNDYDDEDSSIQVGVSDSVQILQDVCSDRSSRHIGATDSKIEDNLCIFLWVGQYFNITA